MDALKKFWNDEQGTETVEWAIIIGIIATGAIGIMLLIGDKVTALFQKLHDDLPTPTT